MLPSVSVVIPTFNGGHLLEKVLSQLRQQRYGGPVDIHVIDSESSDSTLKIAAKYCVQIDSIPHVDFNHGLTRNRAIASSRGDIIVLIAQDAVPANDHLLASLVGNYEDPSVGGCYARQIPRPEHDVLIRRNVQNWFAGQDSRRESFIAEEEAHGHLQPYELYVFCLFDNVCSSVRRTTWGQIPFRTNAFAEDLDWSKRALESGWKIVYEPQAMVIHSHQRPLSYEFRRTRICHRKLHELFGLQTVPHKRQLLRAITQAALHDFEYVHKNEPDLLKKLALYARIPGRVTVGVLGQYLGAQDAVRGTGRNYPDI